MSGEREKLPMINESDVNESIVEQHYICERCQRKFPFETLHVYSKQRFYCAKCCKTLRTQSPPPPPREPGPERDDPATVATAGDGARRRPMFRDVDKLIERHRRRASMDAARSASASSVSRKPIVCPYKTCKRAIAVAHVENHFLHDHKEVRSVRVHLDERNSLELRLPALDANERACLMLIRVRQPRDDVETCDEERPLMDDGTLVLLAARLSPREYEDAFSDDDDEEEEEEEDGDEEEEEEEDGDEEEVAVASEYSCDDRGDCGGDDEVFVWLASNVPTDYQYTVAASTVCKSVRVKYYGAVRTLADDHRRLCATGNGLLLTRHHCANMTANGVRPIKLDVIVHREAARERQGGD